MGARQKDKVFSRPQPGHDFDDAICAFLEAADLGACAMGRNIEVDHRVSEEREDLLIDIFRDEPPGSAATKRLEDAVNNYKYDHVLSIPTPDFNEPSLNNCNLNDSFFGETQLARILDLSGLQNVCIWGVNKKVSPFMSLFGVGGDPKAMITDNFAAWLDSHLDGTPDAHKHVFMESMFSLMNDHRLASPYQPVWATLWDDFGLWCSTADPVEWLEFLGVGQADVGHWLVVLKYPAERIGKYLVRPCQLDAGWYSYHFPSPPESAEGRAMHLGTPGTSILPSPEYIHLQIPLELEDWLTTDEDSADLGLLGKTDRATTGEPGGHSLEEQRRHHHQTLVSVFGSGVGVWMPDPM